MAAPAPLLLELGVLASSETLGVAKDWDDYVKLRELADRLVAAQAAAHAKADAAAPPRPATDDEKLAAFHAWLRREGYPLDTAPVQVTVGLAEGGGLVARQAIKAGDKFVEVPRRLMLPSAQLGNTPWAPLAKDPIVQAMPSLRLTLAVWWEDRQPSSAWRAYLDALPRTFNLPLFFPVATLEMLKGSPTQWEVVRSYKNLMRQYVHVEAQARKLRLPQADALTWSAFLVASAIVLSRQNRIPFAAGPPDMALVPVWDMANHAAEGQITSYYDAETDSLVATAMRDFAQGEQVYIFYGPRTNADFVLYAGFLPDDNPHDAIRMRFALPSTGEHAAAKAALLTKVGLPTSRLFEVAAPVLTSERSAALRTFLRIFLLKPDELAGAVAALDAAAKAGAEPRFSDTNDAELRKYLHTRLSLVLRAYGSSASDDDQLLMTSRLQLPAYTLICLRRAEKRLLERLLDELSASN